MRMRIGKCQVCEMQGVLQVRATLPPRDASIFQSEAEQAGPEFLQKRLMCVSCFEEPSGFQSANVTHVRLENAEYEKDK